MRRPPLKPADTVEVVGVRGHMLNSFVGLKGRVLGRVRLGRPTWFVRFRRHPWCGWFRRGELRRVTA